MSRHPLFDVVVDMMTLNRLSGPSEPEAPGDIPAESVETGKDKEFINNYPGKSKFDLTLYFFEGPKTIKVTFEYNRDLFAPGTIARMAKRFGKLLDNIKANPALSVSSLLQINEEIKIPAFTAFSGG